MKAMSRGLSLRGYTLLFNAAFIDILSILWGAMNREIFHRLQWVSSTKSTVMPDLCVGAAVFPGQR